MGKDTVYLADTTRLPVVARTVGDTRYFVEGCFRQGARETAVEKMRRLILNDTDNIGLGLMNTCKAQAEEIIFAEIGAATAAAPIFIILSANTLPVSAHKSAFPADAGLHL